VGKINPFNFDIYPWLCGIQSEDNEDALPSQNTQQQAAYSFESCSPESALSLQYDLQVPSSVFKQITDLFP